jgi:hypothetical protein
VIDTVEKVTSFTQSNLIGQIKQAFENLPDARSGNGVYQKYAMPDAALSAFSVFFMQSPSFLDYQNTMEKERGKNNAQGLFGVHLIPSANQLRNVHGITSRSYSAGFLYQEGCSHEAHSYSTQRMRAAFLVQKD